jgi:hypothetical protein
MVQGLSQGRKPQIGVSRKSFLRNLLFRWNQQRQGNVSVGGLTDPLGNSQNFRHIWRLRRAKRIKSVEKITQNLLFRWNLTDSVDILRLDLVPSRFYPAGVVSPISHYPSPITQTRMLRPLLILCIGVGLLVSPLITQPRCSHQKFPLSKCLMISSKFHHKVCIKKDSHYTCSPDILLLSSFCVCCHPPSIGGGGNVTHDFLVSWIPVACHAIVWSKGPRMPESVISLRLLD